MPTDPEPIAEIAGRSDYPLRAGEAFAAAGRRRAEQAHPGHAALVAEAATVRTAADQAWSALADARREDAERAARFGRLACLPSPAARLAEAERDLTATRNEPAAAQARIAQLKAEPAYRAQPVNQLTDEPVGRGTRAISTAPPPPRHTSGGLPRTRPSASRGPKTSATCSTVPAPAAGSHADAVTQDGGPPRPRGERPGSRGLEENWRRADGAGGGLEIPEEGWGGCHQTARNGAF